MRQPRRTFSARRLFGAASFLAIAAAAPAMAEQEAQSFAIPSQPLSEAIAEFARQANLDVIAPSALTRGKTSKPVAGEMEPQKALQLLMSDAALDVRRNDGGTLILVQAVTDVPKPQTSPTADPAPLPATPRDPAETADSQPTRATPLQRADRNDDEERTLGRVTVTGTSIRGLAPESSPLQIYTRADILESGATTTEQFMWTVPQNFGGGSSEFITGGLPNDPDASPAATGINLRGLGNGSTLVLLNGTRVAGATANGNVVPLSMLPVSALERIDVLTDGASSIYGGDAVAGVVNFVLRDDFEGSETALRYGSVTSGRMNEYQFSQALGKAWTSGNILGTYEYFSKNNLRLSDRPKITAPGLASGAEAAPAHLHDLSPRQDRHSAMVSVSQTISPSIHLSAFGLYSEANTDRSFVGYIGAGNTSRDETFAQGASFGGRVEYDMSEHWSASVNVGHSWQRHDRLGFAASTPEGLLLGTDSDVWSVDAIVNGDIFDLPGGTIKAAFGGHYREEDFILRSSRDGVTRDGAREVSALFAELHLPVVGPGNSVPGIARLELNLSGRLSEYSDFGNSSNPKVGLLWAINDDLRFRSSYSESFAPPPLGRIGDLSHTGNVYPTSAIATGLGLASQYPSLDGTNYLFLLGVSPNLGAQTSQSFTAGVDFDKTYGSHSWTSSFNFYDIKFQDRLGRVPMPDNQDPFYAPFIFFDNPGAFPAGTIVFFPSDEEIERLISDFDMPVRSLLGGTLENVGIINSVNIIRNLASTKTHGLDLQLDYSINTDVGTISAGLNTNYILGFSQQASATTPAVTVLDTLYNPTSLQFRGKVGLTQGGFSGNIFVNYTDSYKSDSTQNATSIDAWTTVDLNLSYRARGSTNRWFDGVSVSLTVSNLFDESPPRTPTLRNFAIASYDPTNARPIGRFAAVELRKAFGGRQ